MVKSDQFGTVNVTCNYEFTIPLEFDQDVMETINYTIVSFPDSCDDNIYAVEMGYSKLTGADNTG